MYVFFYRCYKNQFSYIFKILIYLYVCTIAAATIDIQLKHEICSSIERSSSLMSTIWLKREAKDKVSNISIYVSDIKKFHENVIVVYNNVHDVGSWPFLVGPTGEEIWSMFGWWRRDGWPDCRLAIVVHWQGPELEFIFLQL